MPRVSRSHISSEKLKELQYYFNTLISQLQNTKQIDDFLSEFLTPEEKTMLSKRLVLYLLLRKEYKPDQMQQALQISYETVRIYTRMFHTKNNEFLQTLDVLLKKEQMRELLKRIDKAFEPLEAALNAKSSMKSRSRLLKPSDV